MGSTWAARRAPRRADGHDLGRSSMLGSEGMWGWDGAASTICRMVPKEHTTLIAIPQRMPFNAEDFLTAFVDVYYASFDD